MARKYLPPIGQILEKHQRLLFLAEPGMGISILARQIESLLKKSNCLPSRVSLKSFTGNLRVAPPPQNSRAHSVAWCLLTDLDRVNPAVLPQLLSALDRLEQVGWRLALFSVQGYVAVHLADLGNRFTRYHLLGLTSADIQRICDDEGVDAHAFVKELGCADLHVEAGNPRILQAMIRAFRRNGKLPASRSRALKIIFNALRKSVCLGRRKQEQALQALGLAMELASRNFLKGQEAELAISARLDLSPAEAANLFSQTASFFLFTPEGLCFPHHSLGEYLAAASMRKSRLSVILDCMFLPGTRNLNTSWQPALGFLAEMNSAVRRYFASHHPDLALRSAFSVLTATERVAIGKSLYKRLQDRKESLWRHPEINASRLARCLTLPCLNEVEGEARRAIDPILASNAFLLLGEAGQQTALPLAVSAALDRTVDQLVRQTAFHAIGRLGTPALIPQLIASVDNGDPCFVSMLVAIGWLADDAAMPQIMETLLSTPTYVHSFYERLESLDPKQTSLALLGMIRQRAGMIEHPKWRFYASCLPGALRRAWNAEIASSVIEALLAIQEAGVLDLQNDFMEDLADAIANSDHEEVVVRETLEKLAKRSRPVMAIPRTLLRLSSPATIRWLLSKNYDERFVASLRMYARGELYQVFEEVSPRQLGEPDPQLIAWEKENRERLEEAEDSARRAQAIVCEDPDFLHVFNAVLFLDEKRLPIVSTERLSWLASEVDRQFPRVDFSKVAWGADNSSTIPWLLYCLLLLVQHYELHLVDDVPLIKSLNSLRGEAAEVHARKFGITSAAQAELEKMIKDASLNSSAVDTILHFIRETRVWTAPIAAALQDRAMSTDSRVQGTAIFTLCNLPDSTEVLIALASQKSVSVPDAVLDELVKRQHRPTIERRLSQLISDPNLLASGEIEFPNASPFDWIGNIREPEVWKKLLRLRGLALDKGYFRAVGIITGTMASIDESRLASSMAGQVSRAPKPWRPWQQTGILESRQRARLAVAKTTAFKQVVSRLQMKSTEKQLKIWCEGITDLPALGVFVRKAIGDRDDVVLQSIGGWSELSNPDWPLERLWDGCLDVVVIADGDNGRDWTRADRPLSQIGTILMKRLEAVGVTGFVLKRYGLENYFSRAAVEAVLGPSVARQFPLGDETRASDIPGYSKGSNGRIADNMSLDDLKNTDLCEILEEIRRRVA